MRRTHLMLAKAPRPSWFSRRRIEVLQDLAAARDRSLAGSVDPFARETVEMVNQRQSMVTLSSCSGRVNVFHRANRDPLASDVAFNTSRRSTAASDDTAHPLNRMKRGSIGRGTIFETHDRPDHADTVDSIHKALLDFSRWRLDELPAQLATEGGGLIRNESLEVKFEPFILHVMCDGVDVAEELLCVCTLSGQRQSGIISASRVTSAVEKVQERRWVCLVRSNLHLTLPLSLDCLRGAVLRPMLDTFVDRCIVHFDENTIRRDRFNIEFRKKFPC